MSFGRIEDTIYCFVDFPTFSPNSKVQILQPASKRPFIIRDVHEFSPSTIFTFWPSKYIIKKYYFGGGKKLKHVSYNEWPLDVRDLKIPKLCPLLFVMLLSLDGEDCAVRLVQKDSQRGANGRTFGTIRCRSKAVRCAMG